MTIEVLGTSRGVRGSFPLPCGYEYWYGTGMSQRGLGDSGEWDEWVMSSDVLIASSVLESSVLTHPYNL